MSKKECPRCFSINPFDVTHCVFCKFDFAQARPRQQTEQKTTNQQSWQAAQYSPPPVQHTHQTRQPIWQCPFCQSNAGYYTTSRITAAGWIVFFVLFLLLCWPLCWIGFFMKEHHQSCKACGMKLS